MSVRTHPANGHHCNNVDDLKPLIGQLGYTLANSWEDENEAYACSAEKCGLYPAASASLDKKTGKLRVIDRHR